MNSAKSNAIIQDKVLKVGHSPDPDDAFMFYGLSQGLVPLDGFKVEHVIRDIQTLNRMALSGELEVTAISAAVYPLVADKYWILSTGASVGRNYGPIVVAPQPFSASQLRDKTIAVPGEQTTAFLLLRLFLDGFKPLQMDFTDVIPAVKSGAADAGLIIHEGQLNYAASGLECCLDLGKIWFERHRLPIPLGLDVVRKDLGLDLARRVNRGLAQSIRRAMRDEGPALDYALRYGRGIARDTARTFVRMYVNEDTLDLGGEGRAALERLYRLGAEKGIYAGVPGLEIIS